MSCQGLQRVPAEVCRECRLSMGSGQAGSRIQNAHWQTWRLDALRRLPALVEWPRLFHIPCSHPAPLQDWVVVLPPPVSEDVRSAARLDFDVDRFVHVLARSSVTQMIFACCEWRLLRGSDRRTSLCALCGRTAGLSLTTWRLHLHLPTSC